MVLNVQEGEPAVFDCAQLQSDVLEFVRIFEKEDKKDVIARNTMIFNYSYSVGVQF